MWDALKKSSTVVAVRYLTDGVGADGREPNIVLMDKGQFKAFRALESIAWQRRPLHTAKALTDWREGYSKDTPSPLSKSLKSKELEENHARRVETAEDPG